MIGVGDQVVIYADERYCNLTSVLPHGKKNEISFAGLVLNDNFCLSASWDEKLGFGIKRNWITYGLKKFIVIRKGASQYHQIEGKHYA